MRTKIRPSDATLTVISYLSEDDTVVILYNPEFLETLTSFDRQMLWQHQLIHAHFMLQAAKGALYE